MHIRIFQTHLRMQWNWEEVIENKGDANVYQTKIFNLFNEDPGSETHV